MRDPLRPIPSPTNARTYWERAAPPPPPSRRASGQRAHASETQPGRDRAKRYDPSRILRDHEKDTLGLDRRGHRRAGGQMSELDDRRPDTQVADVGQAMHERLRGVLGLCTVHGWAIVETLTLSPQGVLLRHIQASDRDLSCETRMQLNHALMNLSPVMGTPLRAGAPWTDARGRTSSPLANVGTHLLGQRVVADASNWANAPARSTRSADNLQVTLVLPPQARMSSLRAPTSRRGLAQLAQVEGRLSSLNDPDPRVLGVALDPRGVNDLRLHLRAARRR